MSEPAPKISLVIATYRPGDAVLRVIDSLDAQTLSQDEFEVIFVDDGSPDDTYAKLQQFAATRPNYRVLQIPNSGWPSRPRNVGIEHARGEYIMFMDHDDSLHPNGLRRAYEYGLENDADIVGVPEIKTSNVWWAPSTLGGNAPNLVPDGKIERLMPFVPHKLYRRRLLMDHGIRFPDRPRALWEDWYINAAAYRQSKVVSVLVDTPVYVRHIHGTNTSNTFDPIREDYWDRLADVMEFVATTFDGPGWQNERAASLARHIQPRVIDPLGRLLTNSAAEVAQMAFQRAKKLIERYLSEDVYRLLPKSYRAYSELIRAGRSDLVRQLHECDQRHRIQTHVRQLHWQDGALIGRLECTWEPNADAPILRESGGRLLRALTPELENSLPIELRNVGSDIDGFRLRVRVRSRRNYTAWDIPVTPQVVDIMPDGMHGPRLVLRGEVRLDTNTAAAGAPLADDLWDVHVRGTWLGMARAGTPIYNGPVQPMIRSGRPAVAYPNRSGKLSLDLLQLVRTLAIDADPRSGPAGPARAFCAPLRNISVTGEGVLPADTLVAIPARALRTKLSGDDAADLVERLAVGRGLDARVVADGAGARLAGRAPLRPGRYVLYARRDGKLHRTPRTVSVNLLRQLRFG